MMYHDVCAAQCMTLAFLHTHLESNSTNSQNSWKLPFVDLEQFTL